MPNRTPTPGEIVIMAAGVVALIFSFFDFYGADGFGKSVWGSGFFPIATLMVIFVIVMAVQIALTKFANVNLPPRPLGFTWEQIHLVLGFFARHEAGGIVTVLLLVKALGPQESAHVAECSGFGIRPRGIAFEFGLISCLSRHDRCHQDH